MAIRRCPYCKAIIDESQKYCNNCGTQLLFPEDESVEEAIKGEKIVDEDFKDADDEDEKLDDSPEEPEDEAARQVIDLEDVLEGGSGFPDELAGERDRPDIDEDPDEDEDEEEEILPPPPPPKRGRPKKAAPAVPPPPPPAPTKAPTRRPTTTLKPPTQSFAPLPTPTRPAEPPAPLDPLFPIEPPPAPPSRPEKHDAWEFDPSSEGKAPLDRDFDPSSDAKAPLGRDFALEAMRGRDKALQGREDESVPGYGPGSLAEPESDEPEDAAERREEADTREEIARLISALEKKHKMARAPDTASKIIAPLEEGGDLPPWSDLGHDTAAPVEVASEPEGKADVSSFVPGDTMDFQDEVMRRADPAAPAKPTIGMPEAPVKPRTAIIFEGYEDTPAEVPAEEPVIRRKTRDFEVEAEDEPPHRDAISETRLPPRRRLGFFRRIAATIFDLVFVSLFWAAAVGLAAMLMDAEAAGLVRESTLPLALLFGVLFAGYLFLFFFFLGETLGGRLMSRRESS